MQTHLSDSASSAAAARPSAPAPAPFMSSDASEAETLRELMRGGSKTFFAASLLLPARVRAPATALYAYCRLADDAIDLGADPLAEMQDLQERLLAIYEGRPGPAAADRALCQVVHRYAIPRELLDALLEGFLWDAQGRVYNTLADVQDYGARVAGAVGAMMALVMDTRSPAALASACELGVAMQLTNIARDVGEDARNGRLYLPADWLREEGVDPVAWLAQPAFTPAIARVTRRLLLAADKLYHRAEHGIAELPLDCRPAIQAARLVYAEIGHQLRRNGLNSVDHRTVVSSRRKLALIAWATGAALLPAFRAVRINPPLPAIRFLVSAVERSVPPISLRRKASTRRRSFDEAMERASQVQLRLLERDQQALH